MQICEAKLCVETLNFDHHLLEDRWVPQCCLAKPNPEQIVETKPCAAPSKERRLFLARPGAHESLLILGWKIVLWPSLESLGQKVRRWIMPRHLIIPPRGLWKPPHILETCRGAFPRSFWWTLELLPSPVTHARVVSHCAGGGGGTNQLWLFYDTLFAAPTQNCWTRRMSALIYFQVRVSNSSNFEGMHHLRRSSFVWGRMSIDEWVTVTARNHRASFGPPPDDDTGEGDDEDENLSLLPPEALRSFRFRVCRHSSDHIDLSMVCPRRSVCAASLSAVLLLLLFSYTLSV